MRQSTKLYAVVRTLLFTLAMPGFSAAQTPQNANIKALPQDPMAQSLAPTLPVKTRAAARNASATPVTTHERFATFLADEGFKSELLVQNLRLDIPVTVTAALLVDQREIPLDPITIPPHSTATVDLNASLGAHGHAETRGAIVVRYDANSYGAVSAVVTSSDEAHHLYLNSVGQSPEEFWYGTALDAVVWAPAEGTDGFIAIMNTTSEPKRVQTIFFVNGDGQEVHDIELAPHQHRLLRIDSLVKRSLASGAGVRLAWTGKPGDIVTEGTLLNKRTGFSKYIRFLDTSLHFSDHSLRTHFLLLGHQPLADSFPAQMSFRSVAAVRNIDSAPVQVTPVVKRLRDGSAETINLNPVTLAANESTTIDFNAEQRAGHLPADFNQGSLQLVPNTEHNSIVAELFNFNERKASYVVGPSFSAFPARATGSIWRLDGTFQTTIVVENTAKKADQVTLKLFSENGAYEKTFAIEGGGLLKINIKDLQQNAVPDKSGNLLLGASGTLSLSGGRGIHSKLSFDKLIHSADESEYVGLLANPCNYVTGIGLFFADTSDPYTYDGMVEAEWTDGSLTDDIASDLGSGNSSLASVIGSTVTVHPVDNSSHSVSFSDMELETACDICSSDDFFTGASLTVPPKPAMQCSPSPVTRGQSATCTINPGVSGGVTYSGWSFTDGTNTVTSSNTASTWSGIIVKAGTVSANVSVGGRPAVPVSAALTVSNRTGFSFTAVSPQSEPDPFSGNGCNLNVPNPPVGAGDAVGKFCLMQHFTFTTSPQISAGPNTGYSYVTSVSSSNNSGTTAYYYVVAPDAQNPASTFYNAQCGNYNPQTNPNGFISGANLLTNTVRHESGTVQSHYGNYVAAQGVSTNNPGTVAESFVELTGSNSFINDVTNRLNNALNTITVATQVEPCDVTRDANCVFQGFINFLPYQACH